MNESMQNMGLPSQKNQGTGVHNCNFVHTAKDSFSFLKLWCFIAVLQVPLVVILNCDFQTCLQQRFWHHSQKFKSTFYVCYTSRWPKVAISFSLLTSSLVFFSLSFLSPGSPLSPSVENINHTFLMSV